MQDDKVTHPAHYTSHPSGIEHIQVTEHMGFCLGNVIKYVWRAELKEGIEDLKKAAWYLDREIKRREAELPKPSFDANKIRMVDDPLPAVGHPFLQSVAHCSGVGGGPHFFCLTCCWCNTPDCATYKFHPLTTSSGSTTLQPWHKIGSTGTAS